MSDVVQPSLAALEEALTLAEELLRNIELSEMPLERLCMKASRLARLLGDEDMRQIFGFEASGYPKGPDGITKPVWALMVKAGRIFTATKKGEKQSFGYRESVETLETQVVAAREAIAAAQDANVSIASANPSQYVMGPPSNQMQRRQLLASISTTTARIATARGLVHGYASDKYHELKFSGISADVFSRIRQRVDDSIHALVPASVRKLVAVYENLNSDNVEDWSNAAHSCRRILQDLADSLFPPAADREITEDGKPKRIKLGAENYINRLLTYIEDHATSGRYREVVGSQLNYLADRLEGIFRAAQKGSHKDIVSREEADRCVVYTYMIVGDILLLASSITPSAVAAKAS